jgi:hypothetical protein
MEKSSEDDARRRLEEAMAILIQNQTSFLAQALETDRITSERFAHIEAGLATILRVLAEHGRMLENLPEAVREKMASRPRS